MNDTQFGPDKRLTDFLKCYWRFENGLDAENRFTIFAGILRQRLL